MDISEAADFYKVNELKLESLECLLKCSVAWASEYISGNRGLHPSVDCNRCRELQRCNPLRGRNKNTATLYVQIKGKDRRYFFAIA